MMAFQVPHRLGGPEPVSRVRNTVTKLNHCGKKKIMNINVMNMTLKEGMIERGGADRKECVLPELSVLGRMKQQKLLLHIHMYVHYIPEFATSVINLEYELKRKADTLFTLQLKSLWNSSADVYLRYYVEERFSTIVDRLSRPSADIDAALGGVTRPERSTPT
ncbi:hypothetical protein EVAR_61095_1 [Eumeta japonica]|uniref:Uncharacterized protein n=1 Tax=Eumeta variegata TaxID=151549 RepID=A0A4C1YQ26_EUMVA|nr:hypothetical protein EVAR_61095_1 [Eumeta japonica]